MKFWNAGLVWGSLAGTVVFVYLIFHPQITVAEALVIALFPATVSWFATKLIIEGKFRSVRSQYEELRKTDREQLQAHLQSRSMEMRAALDASQQKTTELIAANKQLQAKDQERLMFLSVASQELRGSLNSIIGLTQNLLDGIGGPLTEKQQQYLTRITANAVRLTRMTSNLLDLSRIEAGSIDLVFREVGLPEIAGDVINNLQTLAQANGLHVELVSSGETLNVHGDNDRLSQALTNVVDNAIRVTPRGGKVQVKLQRKGAKSVSVAVTDTGPGIPDDAIPKIFDPFSSDRHKGETQGLGLGLAIAKDWIELHGGTIAATSELGKGSTFEIMLPLSTEPPTVQEAEPLRFIAFHPTELDTTAWSLLLAYAYVPRMIGMVQFDSKKRLDSEAGHWTQTHGMAKSVVAGC
jgi:signal transduction histidine kinase